MGCTANIYGEDTGDAAKQPAMHRTSLPQKKNLILGTKVICIISAKIEKKHDVEET